VWPAARFAALFHELSAERLPRARPVIFAGPGEQERAIAAPLLNALPDAVDLVGRLSVPEAAACLARSSLFIGNDSGLMHLAAAAGTPTIGLFGPTDATEYAPSGRRALAVTADTASMDAISVSQVAAAATDLLAAIGDS
jgi:ADP-heptose:LPS heptosyltransferase